MVAKALIVVLLSLISPCSFAEVDRGVDAYEQNKHSVALRYWIPLAREGNALAQNNLGVMYQRGLGVAQNFQKAEAHDVMFDSDDLQWLYGFAYSRCHTVRHNDNGTVFISGNLQTIYKKFKDKIDAIIPGAGNSPVVGGNFFVTPSQYGLHNDSTREKDWQDTLKDTPLDSNRRRFVPWRNVIIPIYTCLPGIESHGVFFDQRHIDFAHVYHHGRKPDQKVATTYPLVDDHKDIDFHLLDGTKQDKYAPFKSATHVPDESTSHKSPFFSSCTFSNYDISVSTTTYRLYYETSRIIISTAAVVSKLFISTSASFSQSAPSEDS